LKVFELESARAHTNFDFASPRLALPCLAFAPFLSSRTQRKKNCRRQEQTNNTEKYIGHHAGEQERMEAKRGWKREGKRKIAAEPRRTEEIWCRPSRSEN
jgi:hypothetical protein